MKSVQTACLDGLLHFKGGVVWDAFGKLTLSSKCDLAMSDTQGRYDRCATERAL